MPTRTIRPAIGATEPGRGARAAPRQADQRVAPPIAHGGDDPADRVAVERAGQADDRRVGDVDRAGVAQHVEQRALPREQAGQGDDERRDPEAA